MKEEPIPEVKWVVTLGTTLTVVAAVVVAIYFFQGVRRQSNPPTAPTTTIAAPGPTAAAVAAAPAAAPAPAAAATLKGDATRGHAVFQTNCAPCHQPEGTGKIGLAPSIRNRDFLALASDEFIRTTITEGRLGTGMIGRPDLAGQATEDIIAWLRALQVKVPTTIAADPARRITGDAVAGKAHYGIYCASCHGPKGEGYMAGGSGPGIGLKGFLDAASDDYIFQTVKHGRIGTAMRSFLGNEGLANLKEQEVFDIIAFLRNPPAESATVAVAATPKAGDAVAGRAVFQTNCAPCHQPEGEGKIGLAPSIRNRDFLALASNDFIRQTILAGRPGTAMIGRPDLASSVPDIIAFLRSLDVVLPAQISADPTVKFHGDADVGGEKYTTYCASCHGASGEGYMAGGSGPGIGLKGFLSVASDDFIYQTVKHGRLGTAMKPFIGDEGVANLADTDIHDIIAFLRRRVEL
jgi:mono/diheme cytochrome c family protein